MPTDSQNQSQQGQSEKSQKIENLIELTNALADLFTQENNLLSAHKASEIAPIQAEKARLANAYGTAIRDLAANRSAYDDVSDSLMQCLRDTTERFTGLAQTQHALLDGANQSASRVVEAVREASVQERSGYGAAQSGEPIVVSFNANA